MNAPFQQVSGARWPNGIDKPIAILRAEPAELEHRYGVRFTRGNDDLDEFHEAALELPSGRPVLLTRHRHTPGPGTTVSVDLQDSAEDARRELAEVLGLANEGFSWVSEDPAPNQQRNRSLSPLHALWGVVLNALSTLGKLR